MSVSASSAPQEILDSWNEEIRLAESFIQTVENGSSRRLPIEGSLEQLEKIRKKLKIIHAAAVGRAKYETSWRGRGLKYLFTTTGTLIDAGFQAATAALWAESLKATQVSSTDAIAIAVSTLFSTVVSKIKDNIWARRERHVIAVAGMEEIIPNKLFIKEIKATIAFYKHIGESHSNRGVRDLSNPCTLSGVEKGKKRFRNLARKVLEQKSEKKTQLRKAELSKRNIVKLCGVYPRMRGDEIEKLSKQFFDLKKVMVAEEAVIEEEFKEDPNINVMALINQLDLQVKDMQSYILDADLLTALQEDLEQTRSKYIANGFRVTFQFSMELGSLISSIIQAVYSYVGSTSTPAKVAGVSLYVINIVLSWINTAFSKEQEIEAEKLQKLHQIHAQAIYASRIEKRIAEERRDGVSSESKSEKLEDCPRVIGGLMGQLPLVGDLGSPLRESIYKWYQKSTTSGEVPFDWRAALVARSSEEKSSIGMSRALSIDDFMIPTGWAKSSSKEPAIPPIPRAKIPTAPDGEEKNAGTIEVVIEDSPKPTGLEVVDQMFGVV